MTRSVVLWLLVLAAMPAAAWADASRPEIVRLRVGIEGRYKVGQWTPVEITLRGGDRAMVGQVALTVPDGDGVPSRVATPKDRPCQVLPGQESSVLLYARFGRVESDALVEYQVGERVAARRRFVADLAADDSFAPAMLADQPLFVEIGSDSSGVEQAVALAGGETSESVVVRTNNVDALPSRWYGYEGVDGVVISTSRPEVFHKWLGGRNARVEALERWVTMGGRLVLLVGAAGSEILNPSGPLARFAPGTLDKMERLRHTSAIEAYADGTGQAVAGSDQRLDMLVPRLKDVRGTVEAWEADLPVIIRARYGFGQVVFVAVDLDVAPLKGWGDRRLLVAKLLGVSSKAEERIRDNSAIMRLGFDDISGQLRSAMDEFTGVRLVPFGVVVAGILLYIVLIGPVDYFLLRRFGRLEWTWFTFPLVAVAFSLAAYWLAYELKGDQVRLNQVDLVDVDTATGQMRGTTWANLFSPRAQRYNLSLLPRLPDGETADPTDVLFSWLGLPGSGLGGMSATTAGASIWRQAYDFNSQLNAVQGMPIQVWSTKSVTSRWSGRRSDAIEADLTQQEDFPSGRLTNALDFPLSDCLLVYDRWVYSLDKMGPGESVAIGATTQRAELKTLLTGRRFVADEEKDQIQPQTTPYDLSSKNISHILRTMMFFKAAGGLQYTRVSNAYQPFVDFSDMLGPETAMLVGAAPEEQHGATLLRDGAPLVSDTDRHITVYRFLIPVEKRP